MEFVFVVFTCFFTLFFVLLLFLVAFHFVLVTYRCRVFVFTNDMNMNGVWSIGVGLY
jgi:hypothetical protein